MESASGGIWSPARRPAARAVNWVIYALYARAVRRYRAGFRRLPEIALPRSYNEKMFWRRVFDRNPAFVVYCDKLQAKAVFASLAPELALPEVLWTGTDPAAMPAELRRPDVVVKFNAGAGRNWFFAEHPETQASPDNFVAATRRWLRRPHPRWLGEWAYTQVAPTLFAERLVAPRGEIIDEFKVHLFNGSVFYTVVYQREKTPHSQSAIFDETGRRLAVTTTKPMRDPKRALPADYCLPDCYGEAMECARRVARGTDYLRVDFMHFRGRLYGGEITAYPTAGLMTNSDPAVLDEMGRVWDLRRSWFMSTPQKGWRRLYQRMLAAQFEAGDEPALSFRHRALAATRGMTPSQHSASSPS